MKYSHTKEHNYAMDKLSINQWSEDDRPREKLERLGADALSDAELLAILIGSGSAKESAVDLMRRILGDCRNNLNTLGKMTIHELTQYHGMGPAKAITILAACELGRRRKEAKAEERPQIGSASAIYKLMVDELRDKPVEEFHALMLNQRLQLIKKVLISRGGLTETAVDVRVIMKEALLCNATAMAVCHNHPSGNTRPSRQDDSLTQTIRAACDTMRIHLVDHVVVADGAYYSYNDEGKL